MRYSFFYYYMANGQTYLGPEVDNAKYPQVKPVDWEGFMRSVPKDQLPSASSSVGQNV